MRRTRTIRARLVGLGIAGAALVASPAMARADEVFFAGSTTGAFDGGSPAASASLSGLVYDNSTFAGTTSNGFLAIGSAPEPPAANFNNLGSFTLSAAPHLYSGNTFQLVVTFTAPAGITGGNPATFSSVVTGSVSSENNGGVLVDFDNGVRTFTFNNGATTGSFTFQVNDVSANAGKTVAVTGQILAATQTTVPEPASMTLLATGLAGMGAAARRRKNNKNK